MALALVPVNIATICIESVFYGIFCALFILSLYLVTKKTPPCAGNQHPYSKPMLIFSILIFLVVTIHWVLSAVRTFQAFFFYRGGQNPAAFLGDVSQFSTVFREGTLLGILVLGDLAIIYRLWAVWCHHRGVMVIPMTLLVVLSVLAVITLRQWLAPNRDLLKNPGELQANTSVWINALCATTFSINIYCTGMIAFKLYRAGRATKDSQFMFIITILMESLSLHSIWGIFFLICYGLNSFLYIPVSQTQCPITGIAFTILHVRVGLRRQGCNTSAPIESRRFGQDHALE